MGSAHTVGTDEVTDYVWVPLDDIKVDGKPVPIPILESLKRRGFVERYDECTGRGPGRPVGILPVWKIEHSDGVVETSEPRPPCDFYCITPEGKSYLQSAATKPTGPTDPPKVEWSEPMSKTEAAKRISGRADARWRDFAEYVEKYGWEQLSPRKIRVRLDRMDAATRARVEKPGP